MADQNPRDGVDQFLNYVHGLINDARFIITSFPNAEMGAVEGCRNKLQAVRTIIPDIDDPFILQADMDAIIQTLDAHISDLQEFLDHPPPPLSHHIPREYTGRPGRPSYKLDVERLCLLHDLGISWGDIAQVYGVTRKTIFNHLRSAGITKPDIPFTIITDDSLDEIVAAFNLEHPFSGSGILRGHLESIGIHLPRARVQESLKRVDMLGVLSRWRKVTKRRIYKVRGSNALWHQDGHEKLKHWGFWVHGCVDGHSRLIIYMECRSNKRANTVTQCFLAGAATFGYPSRMRGDYGKENNGIEKAMIIYWGEQHRAYIRGRSTHNVRIERIWVDIQKDALEAFRQVFLYLERTDLWNKEDPRHAICLFLVFQPRIQKALNAAKHAWNHHQIRTAHYKTPVAMYELSRQELINRGVWTGDVGDNIELVDGYYGVDGGDEGGVEIPTDPDDPTVSMAHDQDIEAVRAILGDYEFERDDGNWGINVYVEAVALLISRL